MFILNHAETTERIKMFGNEICIQKTNTLSQPLYLAVWLNIPVTVSSSVAK